MESALAGFIQYFKKGGRSEPDNGLMDNHSMSRRFDHPLFQSIAGVVGWCDGAGLTLSAGVSY